MKKIIIISFLLVAGFLFPSSHSHSISGGVLYVGGSGGNNYTTLQEAVNHSMDGDTIIIFHGVYEGATIKKSVTVIGRNAMITSGIFIKGNSITLENLLIKDCSTAIKIYGDKNTVKNCTIFNNSYGIEIKGNFNSIISSKIFKNYFYGIYLDYSNENIIEGNEIYRSKWGIYLIKSHGNIISENLVKNNEVGIKLQKSENNIIKLNNVTKNRDNGVYMCCYSMNNLVYMNNFMENGYHAYVVGGANQWDNGSNGNYWDDYNGSNDYFINEKNVDYHPAAFPYSLNISSPRAYILQPEENEVVKGEIMVKGISESENGVKIKVDNGTWKKANGTFLWYWRLDTEKMENGEHTIYVKCGNMIEERHIMVENEKKKTPSFSLSMIILAFLIYISIRKK